MHFWYMCLSPSRRRLARFQKIWYSWGERWKLMLQPERDQTSRMIGVSRAPISFSIPRRWTEIWLHKPCRRSQCWITMPVAIRQSRIASEQSRSRVAQRRKNGRRVWMADEWCQQVDQQGRRCIGLPSGSTWSILAAEHAIEHLQDQVRTRSVL